LARYEKDKDRFAINILVHMLQQDNDFFFAKPQTFFGALPNIEEESEGTSETWELPFSMQIPLHPPQLDNKTGLFIHWFDHTFWLEN
jgi:hypothetical protein